MREYKIYFKYEGDFDMLRVEAEKPCDAVFKLLKMLDYSAIVYSIEEVKED